MCGRWIILPLLFVFLTQCARKKDPLFESLAPEKSGIGFQNTLPETDSLNIININYMYHGGGVAIGDFNNDQLSDIFFTGNLVANRLYLNEGNLRFRDVTTTAAVGAEGKWKSGVALADVNNDGLLDIYVCATITPDSVKRANMLFMNKGLNREGIPVFEDMAHSYGVADTGYSQNAAFLDYDKDGDLDLYVLQNLESDAIPSVYRPRILDGSALNNDRLYRNNGNGSFTDVTLEAGITIEGYGLGIAIADINVDGWPDIYIGNDYLSNDILYINNQDGTFTNEIRERLKHQSLFTMGVDVADINNDCAADIITLDMLPENNLRRKTIAGAGATYYNYINNAEYDYEHQYMRNMLHLNRGDGRFSEIGQLSGIHQTEWSWSSLFADVDNDGYRDLLITNGFPKDVTDRDYVMFKREVGAFQHIRSLLDSIPVLKISNYAFKNNGDLTFRDMTSQWGFSQPSFSNGAAFADLDNDGDLDYVVNNINDPASVYENHLYPGNDKRDVHFLRIRLDNGALPSGAELGTKITIHYGNGERQYHDHSIYRGYLSTVENIIHFGTAASAMIDTLRVQWPDGKVNTLYKISADQLLTVSYDDAKSGTVRASDKPISLMEEVSSALGIEYKHKEWDKVDFYRQRTLPHKFSQSGPGIATGDINGDGNEDFIIGGSSLYNATIFTQSTEGRFSSAPLPKTIDSKAEDEGLLLFDADLDGDLDLYCVSGSYEGEGKEAYEDRLYINDGRGKYTLATGALPETVSSGSCARATDMDADGDLDLFVAGRVVVGAYPLSPESYILRNDHGRFADVTDQLAPGLRSAGMITDALWTDYNNDGKTDLLVVGEFMAPAFFRNTGRGFEKDLRSGLNEFTGWWNSLAAADFDKDGDTDYIAGNLGLNNYYRFSADRPLRVYAKDFDSNGSTDAILSCYFKTEDGEMGEFPVHSWEELYSQSPKFRNQFSSYKQYGMANMEALLKPYDTTGMLVLKAVHPFTSFIRNNGNGTFDLKALPTQVQVAPVNGMVVMDVNGDGNPDVLMTGNDYGNEVFSGRYDAFSGALLTGDGKGNFAYVDPRESGFLVEKDGKALARIRSVAGELMVATQNSDSLLVFKLRHEDAKPGNFDPLPGDSYAELSYPDGSIQKIEFYHGSGYLSQSTRSVRIPSRIKELKVFDYAGNSRVIDFSTIAQARR